MDDTVYFLMLASVLFIIFAEIRRQQNHRRRVRARRHKRKEINMTSVTISDFIGKICVITTEGDWGGFNARVISVKDN